MPLAIFQSVGVWEILLLLLVLLLVFGPKRLPEMGRSLGRGMREFKESITGQDVEREEAEEAAAALTQESGAPTASAAEAASAQPVPAEAASAQPVPATEPAPAPAATTPPPPQPGTEQPSN